MRTIKFRGKNIKGKWVYGDLLRNRGETFIAPDGIADPLATADDFQVTPETVGQFTGLLDINGVEIYEGDIMPIYENGEEYIYKVLYDGDCFMLGFIDSEQGSYPLSTKCNISEVIGNKHDNPELFKPEKP